MGAASGRRRQGGIPDRRRVGGTCRGGAGDRLTVLPESGATYPDRGSRVEVWLEYPLSEPLRELGGLRPGHRVVECEILGPLRTMPPGSSTQMVTDIAGCSGEGPVRGVQAERLPARTFGRCWRAVPLARGGEDRSLPQWPSHSRPPRSSRGRPSCDPPRADLCRSLPRSQPRCGRAQ